MPFCRWFPCRRQSANWPAFAGGKSAKPAKVKHGCWHSILNIFFKFSNLIFAYWLLAIRSFLMLYTSFFSHEIMAMTKSYLLEDFWLKTILCSYSNIIKIWLRKLSQNQLEIIKVSHVCFYLFFIFVICSVKKKLRLLDCWISFLLIFFVCLFHDL